MAALLRWAFPPTLELDRSTEYDPVLFVVTTGPDGHWQKEGANGGWEKKANLA